MSKTVIFPFLVFSLISCHERIRQKNTQISRISIDSFMRAHPYVWFDTSSFYHYTDPFYPGGQNSLNLFIAEYCQKHQIPLLNEHHNGSIVNFDIGKDGEVMNPVIYRKSGICSYCDSVSLNIISASGPWTPSYIVVNDTVYLDSAVRSNFGAEITIPFKKGS